MRKLRPPYLTVLLLLAALSSIPCRAQQDPLYGQYMFNPYLINPAYAGFANEMNITLGYRTQWTGFPGQPQTMYGTGSSSVLGGRGGAGIVLLNDQWGNLRNTDFSAAFSYRIPFKKSALRFGMQAGMQSFRIDYSDLNMNNPGDVAFASGDGSSLFNVGAGAILSSERYFIGFSVPRMLPATYTSGGEKYWHHNQHFYFMASWVSFLNERLRLKPSLLLRGVQGAPLSADLSFTFNIDATHNAGIYSRNFNTLGLLLQTVLKNQYRIGYAFELPASDPGPAFTTHELTLGIQFSAFEFHDHQYSNF